MGQLIKELKRRNVFRMAVLYLVAAWLIMQVTEVVITLATLPAWIGRAVLILLAVGFPIALIVSWIYEVTSEGISLEKDIDPLESITHVTGRRMDFVVISMLCAALLMFATDKWWPRGPIEQSIAVLPFENMSDDASNEYFSDGISEEILNLLTKVPELRVTSRSSAFSFKGQNLDVPTIAAKLNVAHVLEGSVRKSGNQLRITAQLIEVEADRHLWSQTYDRELKNVFAIQDQIAAAVVDGLKITLMGNEPKSVQTDPEAYDLYLLARNYAMQWGVEPIAEAESLLKQALDIDPEFAPAWTFLGRLYRTQTSTLALRPIDEGNELARQAIQNAIAIDPQYARSYAALAEIEMAYDRDFTMAKQHLHRAMVLDSGDTDILGVASRLNAYLGHLDEAIDLAQRMVALAPVEHWVHVMLGWNYYLAHRLDEAQDALRTAESLTPTEATDATIGLVLLAKGDAHAALPHLKNPWGQAIVQHAIGNAEASDMALQECIEEWGDVGAYQIAQVHTFRGDIDEAFDWLETADQNRDGGLVMMKTDPLLANLHNDPRWKPFLDKMGFPD